MNFLNIIIDITLYPLLGILLVRLVKLVDDKLTPFDEDKAMLLESNLAVGLRKAGICLGLFWPLQACFPENRRICWWIWPIF